MTQTWHPETYERNARFVSELGAPVLELLAPKPGERILDLGCGDGHLTARLVAAGCDVVAVDSSPQFIAAAQVRGLDARLADGEHLDFHLEFDAVFSNAALHWMKREDDVIEGVWRALRPGGRFVGEFGGYGCVATIRQALFEALARRGLDGAAFDPWYFPTVEDYGARLRAHGFRVVYAALIDRPTRLPGDVTGWLDTFAMSFTATLPAAERGRFIAEVRDHLRPRLADTTGIWTADYVRLRFHAQKPPA